MIVKPAVTGNVIINPDTREKISDTGTNVTRNSFWLRLIRFGDVVEVVASTSSATTATATSGTTTTAASAASTETATSGDASTSEK